MTQLTGIAIESIERARPLPRARTADFAYLRWLGNRKGKARMLMSVREFLLNLR